jgi:hypothetical protein
MYNTYQNVESIFMNLFTTCNFIKYSVCAYIHIYIIIYNERWTSLYMHACNFAYITTIYIYIYVLFIKLNTQTHLK